MTKEQYQALLADLSASRVAKRSQAGRSLSYLEAWDVRATLNRIFGFLGWSADVLSSELVFEEKNEKGQWNVGYKVTLKLSIFDSYSAATYTEAAVGSASLPQRGDAHDTSLKSASSDALKRAAMNIGTAFGLSLYNDGSRQDVVGYTLCPPEDYEPPAPPTITAEQFQALSKAVAKAETDTVLRDIYRENEAILDLEINGTTVREVIMSRVAELKS
jgi:hypothetical protein